MASTNLEEALRSVAPHLKGVGTWMARGAAGAVLATLQFAVAIIIAGVLLVNTPGASRTALALGGRVAGEEGAGFVALAVGTVRSVARGIVGVALIQATLAGLGFLAVGVPAAGLLALLCLLLCVMQIGPLAILLPAVIYVFATDSTVVAVAFLVWSIFVGLIDNVLKPLLLGRGAQVPMLVVFVGAIGGFLSSGILGLFIGAVVLALGYRLFLAWLSERPGLQPDGAPAGGSDPGM
jgi:predicted PurR-regulated permease PerM